jgi:hypothetical protein
LRSSSTTSTVAAIVAYPALPSALPPDRSACLDLPMILISDRHATDPARLAARLHTVTMSASPGPHDHRVH